ncbi:MAG: hypothetical protein AAGI08_02385 [Bacteroidota bacterium]
MRFLALSLLVLASCAAPPAEPSAMFVPDLLDVTFRDGVTQADAERMAEHLGYDVTAAVFPALDVTVPVPDAWTDADTNQLRETAGVQAVQVHDWREVLERAQEDLPEGALCFAKRARQDQLTVQFAGDVKLGDALAMLRDAGLDPAQPERPLRSLTVRTSDIPSAQDRLAREPAVEFTARIATLMLDE